MKKIECAYCEHLLDYDQLTKDHVLPRSKGGKGKQNILYCCRSCNFLKSDKNLDEFFIFLNEKFDKNHTIDILIKILKVKKLIIQGIRKTRKKQKNIIYHNKRIIKIGHGSFLK